MRREIWFGPLAVLLAGCDTLPGAAPPTGASNLSGTFIATRQYLPLDKGIALVGERSAAPRYFATWNPITRNIHALVGRAPVRRGWSVAGLGRPYVCHAFPAGWCFPASYSTPSGMRVIQYQVLQEKGGFLVSAR